MVAKRKQLQARPIDDKLASRPREGEGHGLGGIALQPVRLVLLLLYGPREGENDFLEFPSIEDAVAYARELQGERRFQLEAIEDAAGKTLVCYDDLNERCRSPHPQQQRRFG
jgi:hypothetical protein